MGSWWTKMQNVWGSLRDLSCQPVFWLGLVGVVALAVAAYWVITRTRFAQVPAIWKCVILSVVAHLLLAVYAYSTLLTQPTGIPGQTAWATVNVVDEAETPQSSELVGDLRPAINRFDTQPELPDQEPLAQPLDDWEMEIERIFENPQWTAPESLPSDAAPTVPMPSFIESLPLTTPPEISAAFNPPTLESELQTAAPDLTVTPLTSPPTIAPTPLDLDRPAEVKAAQPETVSPPESPTESPSEKVVIDGFLKSSQLNPLESRPAEAQSAELQPPPSSTERMLTAQAQPLQPLPSHPPEAGSVPVAPPAENLQPLLPNLSSERSPSSSPAPALRVGDAQPIPAVYALREPQHRKEQALARGGSLDTEKAVDLALAWMARHQDPDGRWNPRTHGGGIDHQVLGHQRPGSGVHCDTAITGLALLSYLAAGQTHLSGSYQGTVGNGLQFLLNQQAADGNLAGQAALYDRMYCHGIALLALSETLAATGDARLLEPVQRAVDYSVRAQHPQLGGWRYQPGDEGDMSQFGWQVMGLHSAILGGAQVPESTIEGMKRFLHSCTRGAHRGLGCYRPGEGHSPTMTAEALLSRILLDENVSDATRNEAIDYIIQYLPDAQRPNYYYWYYGTMALHHVGGSSWERWNQQMQQVLLSKQLNSGDEAGSWPADGLWSGYGGQVYSTAMATLCLEVYYRYRPAHEILPPEQPTK